MPLRIHGLDRSLWFDESWVANALLAPDLAAMVHYESWLQTTPPLFLVLERLVLSVLPVTNTTFRLVPALFGLLGVVLMAILALRLLRPPTAFIIMLFFVLSPAHIIYTQMLKQYASDVAAAQLMMLLALLYLHERGEVWFWVGAGAFVGLAGLSYNAVLFMPAFLYGALFKPPEPGHGLVPHWRGRWLQAGIVILAVLVTSGLNYLVFIAPNLDQSIMPGSVSAAGAGLVERAEEMIEKTLDLVRMFAHFFFNMSYPWGGIWVAGLIVLAALIAFVGLVDLLLGGGRGRPANFDKAMVLGLPIAGAFFLNTIGYYPLGSVRLNLFLLPANLLLFGFGLQAILRLFRYTGWQPRVARRAYPALTAFLAILFVLRISVPPPTWPPWHEEFEILPASPYFAWHNDFDEDPQAAIRHIAERSDADDTVYVHASMSEPFKLYARLAPLGEVTVVRGRIGWPCCPRNPPRDDDPRQLERTLPQEIDRIGNALEQADDPGMLWMLFSGRQAVWNFAGADHPTLFDERLRAWGCQRQPTPEFVGVELYRYDCPPAALENSRTSSQAMAKPSAAER